MLLTDFLNLPKEHPISREDGLKLHRDICLKGIATVPDDQRERLRDYLNNALLHEAVELKWRDKLESICTSLD